LGVFQGKGVEVADCHAPDTSNRQAWERCKIADLPPSMADQAPGPPALPGRGGAVSGPPGGLTLLAIGVAGVAVPLVLAMAGAAAPGPAVIGSAAVAALTAGLLLRHVLSRRAAPPGAGAGVPPSRAIFQRPVPPFAAMLERLADPILLVAGGEAADMSARRFVFANAAARELLRIQRPEGPLTTAVRVPEVLAAIDDALFGASRAEAMYDPGGAQARVWRATALPLPLDMARNPTSGGSAGPLALITFRDETEFRRSERTRADFLANASHELRTPLASLAGFIETLRGHARDDPAARERFLAIMHVQAQRMRRLIDDLMSLSRIELGEHIPPSGEVDMAVAVIDVLDALGPMAAERGAQFRSHLPPVGAALVTGDRDQILQVIQNLAENALKYTPDGATVTVDVAAGLDAAGAAAPASMLAAHRALLTPDHGGDLRYVTVKVRDAGPGIARTHLPRLTERFYRVEGQKSGEHAGTGLGLAIVKHIVNRHRGGLTVESTEGHGATFTAYLPMTGAAGRAMAPGTPPG
jgi:two-component system, OmpR family, phosphate regulon sensor histidine kinase PhoR